MNKRLIIGILSLGVILFTAFRINEIKYRVIQNHSFGAGEVLQYRVHYGFLNAAEASMIVSDKIHNVNGRPCYKIDIIGKSVGVFHMMMRVRDTWGTYVDTSAVIPHKFYRFLEEGKYRKNEVVEFDYANNQAVTKIYEKHDKSKLKKELKHDIPLNVQDMVSGYYFLRTIDYSKMNKGDTITLQGFFDEELFEFQLKFRGKETVKTKLGKVRAIKLQPIMPENEMFDGKNSILVWLSDDKNKIPLKIRAKMFIGAVEIDIKSQKGLRNPFQTD